MSDFTNPFIGTAHIPQPASRDENALSAFIYDEHLKLNASFISHYNHAKWKLRANKLRANKKVRPDPTLILVFSQDMPKRMALVKSSTYIHADRIGADILLACKHSANL